MPETSSAEWFGARLAVSGTWKLQKITDIVGEFWAGIMTEERLAML